MFILIISLVLLIGIMFEEDNEINEQDLLDGLWAGNLGAVAFLYMVTWGERQEDKGGSEEKK